MNNESAKSNVRSVALNMLVVSLFVILMLSFMYYFDKNNPDLKKVEMSMLADSFATSVTNAHWQWVAEGKPGLVMLIKYDRGGNEIGRRPIPMSHLGWPKASPDAEGCERIWELILDQPLEVKSFRVIAEFYDGLDVSGKVLDSRCRYRLSTGPFFEYKIYTGQVNKTNV